MLLLAIHRISDTKAILTIVCPIKIIDDNTNKSLLHYYGKYEKMFIFPRQMIWETYNKIKTEHFRMFSLQSF